MICIFLHLVILAIHVDDCTMTGTSQALIDDYRDRFHRRYSLTNLGPISWLLGIEIVRDRGERDVLQVAYQGGGYARETSSVCWWQD